MPFGAGAQADALRVFGNSALAGLPDYLMGGDAAAKTAAARDHLGLAGDALNAAGWVVPGTALLKGGKIIKAGLAGLKAVGAGRAAAAAGLGVGTLIGYNNRTQPRVAAPAGTTPAKAAGTNQDPGPTPAKAAGSGNPAFDALVDHVTQAQGGQISLNQLATLADISGKTAKTPKEPSIKDVAGAEALELSRHILDTETKAAKTPEDYQSAVQRHFARMAPLYGGSPFDYAATESPHD